MGPSAGPRSPARIALMFTPFYPDGVHRSVNGRSRARVSGGGLVPLAAGDEAGSGGLPADPGRRLARFRGDRLPSPSRGPAVGKVAGDVAEAQSGGHVGRALP